MSKYKIGQKVLHPLHGIGTVETIEEKRILGKTGKFSVINFSNDRLKIMVNLDQKSMIRALTSNEDINKVFDHLKKNASNLPSRSSERYNLNMKKIKSSDIYQMAEVIRDLCDLNKRKKLSRKEASMLKQAKKIFCSEVSYVRKISEEDAEKMLEDLINEPDEEEEE